MAGQTIKIGTLVDAKGANPAHYIRQILPHGFESFQLTFWEARGNVDLKRLAAEVKDALGVSGATISSLGAFGNPLETRPTDLETLDLWKQAIDHARLFGADTVAGFTGRLRGKSIDESIPRFKEIFGD